MAIDRTAYNLLVDDDGSNTIGTLWTKNQVKTVVLDPVDVALALLAPLASPALTGVPVAPTAAPGASTTQLATTAFSAAAVAVEAAARIAAVSAEAASRAAADAVLAAPVVQTTTLTGTQNDFALTAVCGLLRCNNATLLTLTGLAAGVDGQRLDIRSVGAGAVALSNEAAGSVAANRTITGLVESLLLTAGLGVARLVYDATTARWCVLTTFNPAWTDIAYAAGNFVGVGGGTWTVDSGDQIVFRYLKIGRLIFVDLVLNTTTVAGTVTSLSITLPVAIAKQVEVVGLLFDNSGSVLSSARVYLALGTSVAAISRVDSAALAAATNNTYVRAAFFYEW